MKFKAANIWVFAIATIFALGAYAFGSTALLLATVAGSALAIFNQLAFSYLVPKLITHTTNPRRAAAPAIAFALKLTFVGLIAWILVIKLQLLTTGLVLGYSAQPIGMLIGALTMREVNNTKAFEPRSWEEDGDVVG